MSGLDPEATRRAARKGVVTVIGTLVALGLGLLALSQTTVGGEELARIHGQLAWGPLAGATLLMSLAFFIMAFRWRSLMPPGVHPPISGLTGIILAGLLLNYAVPGPAGELAAAWFAHRRYGLGLADALATGVVARLIGLATAAALAAVLGASGGVMVDPELQRAVWVGTAAVGIGGVGLAGLAAAPGPWVWFAERCLGLWPAGWPLAGVLKRLVSAIRSLADALQRVAGSGRRRLLGAAAWSMLGHGTVMTGTLLAVLGVGADVHPVGIAYTYSVSTASAVLLFALPGSQFGWDALFASLLVGTAGLDQPQALAVALIVRSLQLIYMLGGALSVAWLLRATLGQEVRGVGGAPD